MRYRFGHYTLDLQRQELRHADRLIPLRAKAFQLLSYLITQRERVVPKDELLEHIWSGQFIGDATLNSCLKDVRQAVGDDGQTQGVVQTLRGRGYRFIAAVEIEKPQHSAPPAMVVANPHFRCSSCQQPQLPDASFCAACGTALQALCALCQCSTTLPAVFCSACGHRLGASDRLEESAPAAAAEPATSSAAGALQDETYKQVTVLCCTVPNALELAGELGPETMHTIMQTLFAHAQDEVQRYGGEITQWAGDGFTALFGASGSHEEHVRHAVLAALDLQHVVRQSVDLHSQTQGATLALSLGLHTGPVVIGRFIPDAHHSYTATGATTHLATHLQRLAPPDTVLISDTIYQLLETEIEAVPWCSLSISDTDLPRTSYQVQGLRQRRSGVAGRGQREQSHFVGRERELAMLEERLEQVLSGHGQVVNLMGEPGIGKSRLLTEFWRRLRRRGLSGYVGRCLSYARATPYMPVGSLIRDICGLPETGASEVIATRVRQRLEHADLAIDECAPYVLQILGLPDYTQTLHDLNPETVKRRTFQVLRQWLFAMSHQQPLVLAIEDLHWLDHTSEHCINALAESLSGVPILLLATYRPGYQPPWLEKSYALQLALQPLTPHESEQLIQSLDQDQTLAATMRPDVIAKAEGNPFFLEELTYAILTQVEDPSGMMAPDTVQSVVMARLAQLPEATQHFVQLASVIGREIPLDLLQALWDGPGPVEDHLSVLQRFEFLYEDIHRGELIYAFKHALTQEVAYKSLLRTRQHLLHETVGRGLEALYAGRLDDALDQLAYHYGQSGNSDKAVSYLTQLGVKASERFAHEEAVAIYRQALEHVDRLPPAERGRRRLELMLKQAFSLSILGRFLQVHDMLQPQQELVDRMHEPTVTGPYYFRLGLTALYLGSMEQAIQHAQRGLAAAQQCHDQLTIGMVYRLLAWAYQLIGRYRLGLVNGQHAVAILQDVGEWYWLGHAYWDIGANALHLGEFEAASAAITQLRLMGETHADPRLLSLGELYGGYLSTLRGDWAEGIAACQRSLDASQDPIITAAATSHLGLAYAEQGNLPQALACLEQGYHQLGQLRLRYGQGRAAALFAAVLLVNGQVERAETIAQEAYDICRDADYLYGVGLAQRVLGGVALRQKAFEKAGQFLQDALQTFMTVEAQYEVASTYLTLANLAYAQDNDSAAAAYLQSAHDLFISLRVPTYIEKTIRLAHQYGVALAADASDTL